MACALIVSISDCFGLAAVLGSAAARRGGVSLSTGDEIFQFLVELACTARMSKEYFASDKDNAAVVNGVDLTMFEWTSLLGASSIATELSIAAADAVGSILSSASGSTMQLWQQRLFR